MYFVTLFFLFSLRLRFARGTSIATIINRRYSRGTLHIFIKMEDCAFKHAKAACDLEFLKTCKAYEPLPKFLYFKLYKKQLRHSKLYKSWQYKLLNIEISSKNKLTKNLKIKHDKLCRDFENTVARLDFTWLKSYIVKM